MHHEQALRSQWLDCSDNWGSLRIHARKMVCKAIEMHFFTTKIKVDSNYLITKMMCRHVFIGAFTRFLKIYSRIFYRIPLRISYASGLWLPECNLCLWLRKFMWLVSFHCLKFNNRYITANHDYMCLTITILVKAITFVSKISSSNP